VFLGGWHPNVLSAFFWLPSAYPFLGVNTPSPNYSVTLHRAFFSAVIISTLKQVIQHRFHLARAPALMASFYAAVPFPGPSQSFHLQAVFATFLLPIIIASTKV